MNNVCCEEALEKQSKAKQHMEWELVFSVPQPKSGQLPTFVNKVLLIQSCTFISLLSVATIVPQKLCQAVATQAVCLQNLKYVSSGFRRKFA